MKYYSIVLSALLTTACATTAMASASNDATDHINNIAAGKVTSVMQDYANNAVFQWIGGPLDGVYSNHKSIKEVWSKFAKGNAPLTAKIDQITESSNPKGSTVSANVVFNGKKTIKVRYILTYRGGKLVNEIWQIDPKLAAAY